MYNIEDLVSKIVTIKLTSGIELIAQLLGVDNDNNYLQLSNPRIVVINGEELALIPYLFTGPAESITIPTINLLSIVESHTESSKDYERIIESPEEVIQNAEPELVEDK